MTAQKSRANLMRIGKIILAIILVVGLIPGLSIATNSSKAYAAGDNATLIVDGYIDYGGYSTCNAFASINGGDYNRAYCANPSLNTPTAKTYSAVALDHNNDDVADLAAAMWYSYDGPGFWEGYNAGIWPDTYYDGSKLNPTSDPDRFRALSHIIISDIYASDGAAALSGCSKAFQDWAYDNILGRWDGGQVQPGYENATRVRIGFEKFSISGRDWPATFDVYDISTGSTQHMITYTYVPTGNAYLHKESASSFITPGNRCYTVGGAEFGVYASYDDAVNDSNRCATLISDGNGDTNSVELDQGHYYAKEVKAPSGHGYTDEIAEATVEEGATACFELSDPAVWDPYLIHIFKADENDEAYEGELYGDMSLAGAEYTVDFYGDYWMSLDELYAAEDANHMAQWVFKTDSDGDINLNNFNDHYVSGGLDNGEETYFHTISDPDTAAWPLGTYVIYETAAPAGYKLSEATYLVRLGQSEAGSWDTHLAGDVNETTRTVSGSQYYVGDLETEKLGGVSIQKVDAETELSSPLGGAALNPTSFELYNASENKVEIDGVVYEVGDLITTISTDESGIASTASNYLPYGTYKLVEVETGEGYKVTAEPIIFSINEDHEFVELDGAQAAANQVIRGDIEFDKADELNQTRMANQFC